MVHFSMVLNFKKLTELRDFQTMDGYWIKCIREREGTDKLKKCSVPGRAINMSRRMESGIGDKVQIAKGQLYVSCRMESGINPQVRVARAKGL